MDNNKSKRKRESDDEHGDEFDADFSNNHDTPQPNRRKMAKTNSFERQKREERNRHNFERSRETTNSIEQVQAQVYTSSTPKSSNPNTINSTSTPISRNNTTTDSGFNSTPRTRGDNNLYDNSSQLGALGQDAPEDFEDPNYLNQNESTSIFQNDSVMFPELMEDISISLSQYKKLSDLGRGASGYITES